MCALCVLVVVCCGAWFVRFFVVGCSVSCARCPVFVMCCLLLFVCYLFVGCVLRGVCRLLFKVRALLMFVYCCLLLGVCCFSCVA